MTVLVFQYESRKENYLLALMERNREYCLDHGYRYLAFSHPLPLPTYWIKVWMCLDLMLTMNQNDIIVWLDSDAVFVNRSTKVESLFKDLPQSVFFLASRDPAPWPSIFNAGVFVIRINPESIQLMQDWINCYNPSRWVWNTTNNRWSAKGAWAQEDYEQGAFVKWIFPKYKHHIELLESDVFCCVQAEEIPSQTVTSHFCGSYKNRIKTYLQQTKTLNENWDHLEIKPNPDQQAKARSQLWILVVILCIVIPMLVIYINQPAGSRSDQDRNSFERYHPLDVQGRHLQF